MTTDTQAEKSAAGGSPAVVPTSTSVESLTSVQSPYVERYALDSTTIESMSLSEVEEYIRVQGDLYDRVTGEMTENVTDRAAYATRAAMLRGIIGGVVEGKPLLSHEKFVQHYFRRNSKSLAGGWLTLSHALQVVGLSETDPVYVALRNSNAYGYTDVKEAVMKDGATVQSIAAALEPYANLTTGKRLSKDEKSARLLAIEATRKSEEEERRKSEEAEREAEHVALLLAAGKSEEEAQATIAEVRAAAEEVAERNAAKVLAATSQEVPSEAPSEESGEGDAVRRLYLLTSEVQSAAQSLGLDDWNEWADTLSAWLDSQRENRKARLVVKPAAPKRSASKRTAAK